MASQPVSDVRRPVLRANSCAYASWFLANTVNFQARALDNRIDGGTPTVNHILNLSTKPQRVGLVVMGLKPLPISRNGLPSSRPSTASRLPDSPDRKELSP